MRETVKRERVGKREQRGKVSREERKRDQTGNRERGRQRREKENSEKSERNGEERKNQSSVGSVQTVLKSFKPNQLKKPKLIKN